METEHIVIIILAIMLAMAIVAIVVLIEMRKKENNEWQKRADERYDQGKYDAAESYKVTLDKIEEDKCALEAKSEKELMVEVMQALSTNGRRLDRMDDKLASIWNYKSYIDVMNKQVKDLADNALFLHQSMGEAKNQVDGFRQNTETITTAVRTMNATLKDVGMVEGRIAATLQNLQNVAATLASIEVKTNRIITSMNGVFEQYGNAPMVVLNDLGNNANAIKLMVERIEREVGEIEKVKNSISEVQAKCDYSLGEFDCGSLYSRVDEVKSEIDSIKEAIGNIESKYDDALSEYGCNSIYSKLEEIDNKMASMV